MSSAWLSQMPVSNTRSGKRLMTFETPVPSGIAAVQATTFGSRAIRSARISPNAPVKLRALFLSSTRQPSLTSSSPSSFIMVNGLGEWKVVESPSANLKPLPLTVFTWRTIGRSKCFASLRTSMSAGMSCPSTGPTVTSPKCSNQASSLTQVFETSPSLW